MPASPFAPQMALSPKGYTDPDPTMPDPVEWVMEPKLDGWRFIFHIREDGRVDAYGRRGPLGYNVPAYITDELVRLFPPDSVVDTELIVDGAGKQSTDVAVVLANHRAGTLSAFVFDVMRVRGMDARALPWSQRRKLLEQALRDAEGQVRLIPVCDPCEAVFAAWMKLDMEGAVLKRRGSPYSSGARNGNWIKLKPQHTVDVTIVGFEEGAGKRARQMATIEFDHNGSRCVATVADYDLAADMYEHPERYLGRLVEVAYHQGRANGAAYLRHPICTRMRPDLEEVTAA